MGLTYPKIQAEGLLFREKFINSTYITDNKGTLVGAPIANNGITLNGTSQSVTYTEIPFNDRQSISIEVAFTPDFAYDEDAIRFIIDSTTSHRYSILKFNNASSNILRINLGNTSLDIASATYSAYWNVGSINHLVVCSNGSNTSVYLNNNVIANETAHSWTPKTPTTIYIGSSNGGIQWFDGIIQNVSVYNSKLSAAEVADRFIQQTFSEVDVEQLEFFLPLRTHYNNGTTELTLNLGIIGDDTIKWGNGVTPTTHPTLLENNGAYFDGGDYILVNSSVGIVNTDSFTLGCLFNTKDTTPVFLMDCRNGTNGFGIILIGSKLRGFTNTGADGKFVEAPVAYNDGQWHSLIVSFIPGTGTIISIYIDGELKNSGDVNVFTNATISPTVGCENDITNIYTGSLKFPFFWRIALTPTQVRWQHQLLFSQINL